MKLKYRHVRFTNEDRPSWSNMYDCIGTSGSYTDGTIGTIYWWNCRWMFFPETFIEFTVQQLADIQQFMRLLPKPKAEE